MSKLDERRKKILRAIIQSHIDCNMPIGSLFITQNYQFGLSPATIRSAMSKLEDMGYLTQPHTSAGRIPTEKGYRFYIDALQEDQTYIVSQNLSDELSIRLNESGKDDHHLVREATKTLSVFSHYLALAIPPRADDMVLKRVKFIKYENKKVLSVLISEEGIVNNKIIRLDKLYTQTQLDTAADYLNNKFGGLKIRKVREKIAYELYRDKQVCDSLIAHLLEVCREAMTIETDTVPLNELSGASFLPDFATMQQIKEILKAIEGKEFMLKLLNQLSGHFGTRVFVGMENIFPDMKDLSMVISTYNDKGLSGGAIGIIGPTRMNYQKMIPIVDHTARALTQILAL